MAIGATIIVVEDEPGTRITLCGILLEDTGYKVIGLERGTDTLEMIRKGPFDVIITDIRLPDVSGLEILALPKVISEMLFHQQKGNSSFNGDANEEADSCH